MKSRYAQREESVEAFLTRRVVEEGGETRKLAYPGRRRATDRLCGLPYREVGPRMQDERQPRHFVVEVKAPGLAAGFPRANDGHEQAQWREHERLRSWGFEVHVIDSKEDVERLLK